MFQKNFTFGSSELLGRQFFQLRLNHVFQIYQLNEPHLLLRPPMFHSDSSLSLQLPNASLSAVNGNKTKGRVFINGKKTKSVPKEFHLS